MRLGRASWTLAFLAVIGLCVAGAASSAGTTTTTKPELLMWYKGTGSTPVFGGNKGVGGAAHHPYFGIPVNNPQYGNPPPDLGYHTYVYYGVRMDAAFTGSNPTSPTHGYIKVGYITSKDFWNREYPLEGGYLSCVASGATANGLLVEWRVAGQTTSQCVFAAKDDHLGTPLIQIVKSGSGWQVFYANTYTGSGYTNLAVQFGGQVFGTGFTDTTAAAGVFAGPILTPSNTIPPFDPSWKCGGSNVYIGYPHSGDGDIVTQAAVRVRRGGGAGQWAVVQEGTMIEPAVAVGWTSPMTAYGDIAGEPNWTGPGNEADFGWYSGTTCNNPINPPDPPTQCSNGLDDDGDGKIDLSDPGCTNSQDDSESPDPPPPPPAIPATGLLDDFNRGGGTETPVSQGGMWAGTGAHGGYGAPLSNDRLENFAQPSYSYRVTPYVGGDMESWVTITTRPNQNHWLSVLICLQDAGTAGWDGYELRATVQSGPDRWEIRRITDGGSTGIATMTMEIAAGGAMLLRRSGVDLQFWWKPPSGTWAQKLSVGNADYMWGMIGVGGHKTGTLDDFGGGSLLSLLEQYVPELRLDTLEGYRADSAAMMTDSYVPGDHSNELRDSQDAVLAASDPAIPTPATPLPLSLNYLATYVNPQDTHKIREASSYKADADRMRAQPQYANKVYGRVFNYNGIIALQYWFFYYYNPKTFYFFGNHEGDWESITVLLNSNGTQVGAAYSQHSYGETCAWPRVEKTFEGRPRVYVGEGSHASYFTASPPLGHPVYIDVQSPPAGTDNVDGLGVPGPLIPSLTDITNVPAWMNWPGRWGASGNSPPGPPGQGFKWDNPVLWAFSSTDQLQCRTSALVSRQQATQTTRTREDHTLSSTLSATNLGLPPAPTVRARLVGRKAVIDYQFKSFPTDRSRRPWMLVTSVVSASPRYTPYTVRTRVTDRSGRVIQRRGAGPGPFKLRVATLSAVGTRSQIIEIPLKVASG